MRQLSSTDESADRLAVEYTSDVQIVADVDGGGPPESFVRLTNASCIRVTGQERDDFASDGSFNFAGMVCTQLFRT